MTWLPFGLALGLALGWNAVLPRSACAETVLDTVSVQAEADKETAADEETASVSTLTADQLSREMASTIKDAMRYEPGVSVTNKPSRFGLSGFNIRGVDDNRILMQIDGVRLPDAFVFGGFASAGRDMADIGLFSKIDIQRGSASALYGSGALGGAVSYATPEPEDWLKKRNWGAGIETLYQSADDSKALIATGAAGNDTLKFLLRGVRRAGRERETQGTLDITGINRTVANPQEVDGLSGLLKIALTPSSNYRASLALESFARDVNTHILSGIVGITVDLRTEDRTRRQRISLDQRFSGLPLGTLDFKLYHQTSRTRQDTFDNRLPAALSLVERKFDMEQDISGLKLAFDTLFEMQGAHRLVWGMEASRRETIEMRDGQEYFPSFNIVVKQVSGIAYPARDYPPSTIDEIALFAQDKWWVSKALSVILGLRYDRYNLKPEPDALYLASNPGIVAVPLTTDALSPKLGAILQLGSGYSVAAQYATGFRAPPYDDVNVGFTNPGAYIVVPNADLVAETSHGPELTLRRTHAQGQWHVSAFDTHYSNFIEQGTLHCPRGAPPPLSPLGTLGPLLPGADPQCSAAEASTFQARNLEGVRIYGIEAGLRHRLAADWMLHGSLAYARGRDADKNPLDSINPLTAVLGRRRPTQPGRQPATPIPARRIRRAGSARALAIRQNRAVLGRRVECIRHHLFPLGGCAGGRRACGRFAIRRSALRSARPQFHFEPELRFLITAPPKPWASCISASPE